MITCGAVDALGVAAPLAVGEHRGDQALGAARGDQRRRCRRRRASMRGGHRDDLAPRTSSRSGTCRAAARWRGRSARTPRSRNGVVVVVAGVDRARDAALAGDRVLGGRHLVDHRQDLVVPDALGGERAVGLGRPAVGEERVEQVAHGARLPAGRRGARRSARPAGGERPAAGATWWRMCARDGGEGDHGTDGGSHGGARAPVGLGRARGRRDGRARPPDDLRGGPPALQLRRRAGLAVPVRPADGVVPADPRLGRVHLRPGRASRPPAS